MELQTSGVTYLTEIDLRMVMNIVMGAGLLAWNLWANTPLYAFQWRGLNRKEKFFAAIEVSIMIAITVMCLIVIRRGVNEMSPGNQTLFSIGLSIGTAVSLCIIIAGGFVGVFSRTFVDLIITNLTMIRHITFLISSVFLGVYLGLYIRAYNPEFVWQINIESIVGLFFALLLMGWVYGVLHVAVTHTPSAEDVERKDFSDWAKRKFIALEQRIMSSSLYKSIDTMAGNLHKKSLQRSIIMHLFSVLIITLLQVAISTFFGGTKHLMEPRGREMVEPFMMGVNFLYLTVIVGMVIKITTRIIIHHQEKKAA